MVFLATGKDGVHRLCERGFAQVEKLQVGSEGGLFGATSRDPE